VRRGELLCGLGKGSGWVSGDGRERRVELGAAVPMAMGRSGSGSVEGVCACEEAGLLFYRRRAPNRGNGRTDGTRRAADRRGGHGTWHR
jgi:hypothetical protein